MPENFLFLEFGCGRAPPFLLFVLLDFSSLLGGGHTLQEVDRTTFFPGHGLDAQSLWIALWLVYFVKDAVHRQISAYIFYCFVFAAAISIWALAPTHRHVNNVLLL